MPEQRSRLIVWITPGDATVETIRDLFLAMDALYRTMGGSGLRIEIAREEPK